jgi:integrase
MLKVVDPHSPENPWTEEHARFRNALIIQWLDHLGLRRGELLGIRVSDIDFKKGTVKVQRRADDVHDPRRYQPNVKTRARVIPLSPSLQDATIAYIMNQRVNLTGARKHDFLFVSSDSGSPLSIPSLAKVFRVLRSKCPDLPPSLSPHVLRHTWNDRFSDEMEKQRVPEETEKKTRSYLMGWSETSGMAATYTRRYIRKKAQQASLAMQESMLRMGKE